MDVGWIEKRRRKLDSFSATAFVTASHSAGPDFICYCRAELGLLQKQQQLIAVPLPVLQNETPHFSCIHSALNCCSSFIPYNITLN